MNQSREARITLLCRNGHHKKDLGTVIYYGEPAASTIEHWLQTAHTESERTELLARFRGQVFEFLGVKLSRKKVPGTQDRVVVDYEDLRHQQYVPVGPNGYVLGLGLLVGCPACKKVYSLNHVEACEVLKRHAQFGARVSVDLSTEATKMGSS